MGPVYPRVNDLMGKIYLNGMSTVFSVSVNKGDYVVFGDVFAVSV